MKPFITPNRLLRQKKARLFALVLSLIFAVGVATSAQPASTPIPTPFATQRTSPIRSASAHDVMLKVWEEHVAWMRHYVISAAANLPDKELVAERLMRNEEDIGRAFKPYYGVAMGDKLTGLLKEHVRIAAYLVAATKAGDNAKQNEALAAWNTNADDIAALIHETNPEHWPLDEMRNLFRDHLQLTVDVIAARVRGEWSDDIARHDKVHRQILILADTLSAGIAKQFPDKAAEQR